MTPHVDVGAYLLGALDDAEMTRFEEHLAECESCGRDLDELSPVVPVMDELRADGIGHVEPPGDAMLERLLGQIARERLRRRRRRLAAVGAAAVLVLGGPAVAVLATQDGDGGPPAVISTFAADRRSAANPATGASAVVGITDNGWGSAVDLRLTGVRGPRTCSLIAVGQDGSRQTVATWAVPAIGYGTKAQPTPLTVHGATGLHKPDIDRFDVQTTDGTLLVSVKT